MSHSVFQRLILVGVSIVSVYQKTMEPTYVLERSKRTEVCRLVTFYSISSKTQSNFSIWMTSLNSGNMRGAEIFCVPEHVKVAIGGFWMGRCCEVKDAIGAVWMGRCCVVNCKGEDEVKLNSGIYWYICESDTLVLSSYVFPEEF